MISIDEDPANDGWIHSMRKVSKNRRSNSEIAKGILGEGSFLDLINGLLGLLTHHKLEKEVISASHDGLRLGINTAKLDIGVDELEPDRESLARIGLRARALSDRTMSKARGDLAFNAEKLYQELDAAIESGMAEREALGKIRSRVGKLFTDALKPHELERLVRDQFLVATKEGRRSGWAQGDVKWRQWAIHSDSKTGEDSKRMKGQITGINEPYTDPKTGDKYMIEHIRPNDRCYGIPLFELPETTIRGGLMYVKSPSNDFEKGGPGSGIKGHTTFREMKHTVEQSRNYEDVLIRNINTDGGNLEAWERPDEVSIVGIRVDEDKRRRGIGSNLVDELIKTYKTKKIIAQTSNIKSINLFYKKGFRLDSLSLNETLDRFKESAGSIRMVKSPDKSIRKTLNIDKFLKDFKGI